MHSWLHKCLAKKSLQIKSIVLRQFICINSLVLSYSLLTLWILLSCVVYNTTEEDNLFFDILTASYNVSHCDYNTCIARKHYVTREKSYPFLNTEAVLENSFYSFTINDHWQFYITLSNSLSEFQSHQWVVPTKTYRTSFNE